jgi:hypothetical protein
MRQLAKYKFYMAITILCGLLFLVVKLSYEWPAKFNHFGVFVRQSAASKYEEFLGNKHLTETGQAPRWEISGHLLDAPKGSPYAEQAHHNAEHFAHETHRQDAVTQAEDDYVIQLDPVNADPDSKENDRPHFLPRPLTSKLAVIKAADVESAQHLLRDLFPDHWTPRTPCAWWDSGLPVSVAADQGWGKALSVESGTPR